jgi:hypothetical protein
MNDDYMPDPTVEWNEDYGSTDPDFAIDMPDPTTDYSIDYGSPEQAAQDAEVIAALTAEPPETLWDSITGTMAKAGTKLYDSVKSRYTASGGGVDWGKMLKDGLIGAAALKAYSAASNPIKTGYQGGIPKYTAVREALPGPAAGTRPGAGGHRYLTDTTYANAAANQAGAGGLAAIQARTGEQATSLDTQNRLGLAGASTAEAIPKLYQDILKRAPDAGGAAYWANQFGPSVSANEITALRNAAQPELAANPNRPAYAPTQTAPAALTPAQQQAASDRFFGRTPAPVQAAQGGLMGLAKGGKPTQGRYLQGATDGMADKLPARIDGGREAALSHGEFVIPADVVSHLGNGNSDAGAKHLYKMMDNIRKARTGNKKQGKEINPDKFTPGGLAGYAAGGVIGFAGTTTSSVPTGTVGTESNLSNWAGPYVTDMLAKGQALSETPYQAYTGPLTAGPSDLQTQAFGYASNLAVPSSIGAAATGAANVAAAYGKLPTYTPTTASNQFKAPTAYKPTTATNQYTGTDPYVGTQTTYEQFGTDDASQYMNPYLQQSLDPQLAEARRQSNINQLANAAQMTKAGAFGGSRSALLQAENQRNLGTNLANITGQGYNTAYTNAMAQFNADQARNMQAQAANVGQQQFGAGQAMANAQNSANYGQQAQASTLAERQFAANQAMTAAANKANYGQQAQASNIAQQQFGATYGLNALASQLGAYNTLGNLGVQQNAAGLSNLNALLTAGGVQQGIAAQGVAADQAAFAAERDNPYKMVQYQQSLLQGLPLQAQSYNISTNPYSAAMDTAAATNKIVNAVS